MNNINLIEKETSFRKYSDADVIFKISNFKIFITSFISKIPIKQISISRMDNFIVKYALRKYFEDPKSIKSPEDFKFKKITRLSGRFKDFKQLTAIFKLRKEVCYSTNKFDDTVINRSNKYS